MCNSKQDSLLDSERIPAAPTTDKSNELPLSSPDEVVIPPTEPVEFTELNGHGSDVHPVPSPSVAPPQPTNVELADAGPSDTENVPPEAPVIGGELPRRGAKPDSAGEDAAGKATGSLLPVILIVIGVVVTVVLIGAVVSSLLKSSLASGGGAPSLPPVAPEQQPLNEVQAQRTAQMDW